MPDASPARVPMAGGRRRCDGHPKINSAAALAAAVFASATAMPALRASSSASTSAARAATLSASNSLCRPSSLRLVSPPSRTAVGASASPPVGVIEGGGSTGRGGVGGGGTRRKPTQPRRRVKKRSTGTSRGGQLCVASPPPPPPPASPLLPGASEGGGWTLLRPCAVVTSAPLDHSTPSAAMESCSDGACAESAPRARRRVLRGASNLAPAPTLRPPHQSLELATASSMADGATSLVPGPAVLRSAAPGPAAPGPWAVEAAARLTGTKATSGGNASR